MTFSILDMLAIIFYFAAWLGYTFFARQYSKRKTNIALALNYYRYQWMIRMLERDNRVADTNSIGNLQQSVTFFASTTLFIIAGLLTVLGATDQAIPIISAIPGIEKPSRGLWEIKFIILTISMIYAFFNFSWSMRLYNFSHVMIASAPRPNEPSELKTDFAKRSAQLISRAGNAFNYGLRAYYFSLSLLSWFIHPAVFMGCVVWIVHLLLKREFYSKEIQFMLTQGRAEEP